MWNHLMGLYKCIDYDKNDTESDERKVRKKKENSIEWLDMEYENNSDI